MLWSFSTCAPETVVIFLYLDRRCAIILIKWLLMFNIFWLVPISVSIYWSFWSKKIYFSFFNLLTYVISQEGSLDPNCRFWMSEATILQLTDCGLISRLSGRYCHLLGKYLYLGASLWDKWPNILVKSLMSRREKIIPLKYFA